MSTTPSAPGRAPVLSRERATRQSAITIVDAIEQFLHTHPASVLLEDGRVLFDLAADQYSLRSDHDFCTLHLWSNSLNAVRRIVSVTPRGAVLRLAATRFGQQRTHALELAPSRQVRSSPPRDARRRQFLRQLERMLLRAFPDDRAIGLRTSMDLERSFGPAFARGSLVRGREAWAMIAINPGESQSTIDGILSIGLLWLEHCREHAAGRRHYCGLRLIVPAGTAATTLSRLRWLRPGAAHFELYTFDDRSESLTLADPTDHGNQITRLLHAPDEAAARERFAEAIARVRALLPEGCRLIGLGTCDAMQQPEASRPSAAAHRNNAPGILADTCELRLRSSAELALLRHGLEFARIRSAATPASFRRTLEITVGHGTQETALTDANAPALRTLIAELFARRSAAATDAADELFRAQPERWLESTLSANLSALDPALEATPVYTQVPAFTGAGVSLDRGMLDLLAATTSHRLAVIELKAGEDLHLALQGLDYWIRVREHHLANVDPATGLGDLQRHGYFPRTRLTAEAPHLYLVAPALHIHPATETILRYLDPAIAWTLIALDERWRIRIKPVWVRRSHT